MPTKRILFAACIWAIVAQGQYVSREYIRFNGSVVAVESPGVPSILSLSPVNGSGPSAVFTATFSDTSGASHIQYVEYWFGAAAANCHLAYYTNVNQIYLDSAANNYTWVGNGAPGSAGTLTNGTCSVALSTSSASFSGNTLTLAVSISFATTGAYTEYLSATNVAGTNGWTSFGTWTVGGTTYPGAGIYDDRDVSLSYTGTWGQAGAAGLYDSTESYGWASGDKVTFHFNGTQISYVYTMAQNLGYSNIYIDGTLVQSNLDAYLAPTGGTANYLWQKLWTRGGLAAGNHTIEVVAAGTNNPSATDHYVTVDAFIVGTSYNDNSSGVSYGGGTWSTASAAGLWNGDEHYSNTSGYSATFSFTGPFVTYVYAPFNNMGIANIAIDGVSHGTFDEYCPTNLFQGSVSFAGLGSGSHTFTITVSGSRNAASSDTYLTTDQFIAAQ